jgi:hypothetical protein
VDNRRNPHYAKAKNACRWLEVAGFKIIAESAHIGSIMYIEVEWRAPNLATVPSYESFLGQQLALAKLYLNKAGLDVEPIPVGYRFLIPVSKTRNRRGRPNENQVREIAQKLRDDGLTYSEIAKRMFELTEVARTPDAYRKLLGNRSPR